jgi:hypothetical protein
VEESERRGRGRPKKVILEPIFKRPKGRPRKDLTGGYMIRYYIVDKTGEGQLSVKASADSVAVFLKNKEINNFIVIKSGRSETVVNLVGLDYNSMVTTLEKS